MPIGRVKEMVGYSTEGGEESKKGPFSLKKTFAKEFSIISMGGMGTAAAYFCCASENLLYGVSNFLS